jgi:hypothetical protein
MTQWYDALSHVARPVGLPVDAGTTFEIMRSLPGGPAINVVKVTEYEPDRLITFESERGPTPFRYRYRLEPVGRGTQLTLDGVISADGLVGPAAHLGAVASTLFKRGMQRNLNNLKRLVESEHSHASSA